MPVEHQRLKTRADRLQKATLKLNERILSLKKKNRSLQEALNENKRLLREVPGAIFLIQRGKIRFINKAGKKYLGLDEEEIIGQRFGDFLSPSSAEKMQHMHQKRIAGKSVPDRYEMHLTALGEIPIWAEISVKKIMYQGEKAFLINMLRVDQRKHDALRHTETQKMDALRRMASGINRELDRFCALLQDDSQHSKSDTPRRDLREVGSPKHIEAAIKDCHSINEKFLCVGKAQNDQAELKLLDLNQVVRDAAAKTSDGLVKDTGKGSTIRIKTYLRALSPVEGHPDEIPTAVDAMLSNAIDALPEGGDIYMTTEENAGHSYLYIQDDGTGISKAVKNNIFDPFFTTRGDARFGLGLSLSEAIIRRHGGTIEVLTHEGRGTTFIVRLPVAPQGKPKTSKRLKNKIKDSRVLIISDDNMVDELLSIMFRSRGGNVTVATSQVQGLKLVKKNPFDLIILDMGTAYIRVGKTIEKIKEAAPSLPVTVIHARRKMVPESELKKLGADLIIDRPLNLDWILSHVTKIL